MAMLLLAQPTYADTDATTASFHIGFMYPNGVDVAGYTVEEQIGRHAYSFYTFGIPSFAAIGVSYYSDYASHGWSATIGAGLGSIMYGSLAYQWKIREMDFVKLGAGATTGVAYSGAFPVISYEHRFYK